MARLVFIGVGMVILTKGLLSNNPNCHCPPIKNMKPPMRFIKQFREHFRIGNHSLFENPMLKAAQTNETKGILITHPTVMDLLIE